MEALKTLYIVAAIFGAVVIAIDLLGLLSVIGESSDHDGGHDGDSGHGHADDGDTGTHDDAHSGEDSSNHDEDRGAAMMHHAKASPQTIVVRFIGWLKSLVYFALGFGAVGWFALATGRSAQASLIWSVAIGIVAMVVARLVKRLQKHELRTEFTGSHLLMAEAEVLVRIDKGQIGKIRIRHAGITLDRYAKAQDPEDSYPKGAKVRVVDMNDEYFYVGLV